MPAVPVPKIRHVSPDIDEALVLIKSLSTTPLNETTVAAKVIVPSQWWKKELIKKYRLPVEKVMVTYEGIDLKFRQTKKQPKARILKKYGGPSILNFLKFTLSHASNKYPCLLEFFLPFFSKFGKYYLPIISFPFISGKHAF